MPPTGKKKYRQWGQDFMYDLRKCSGGFIIVGWYTELYYISLRLQKPSKKVLKKSALAPHPIQKRMEVSEEIAWMCCNNWYNFPTKTNEAPKKMIGSKWSVSFANGVHVPISGSFAYLGDARDHSPPIASTKELKFSLGGLMMFALIHKPLVNKECDEFELDTKSATQRNQCTNSNSFSARLAATTLL